MPNTMRTFGNVSGLLAGHGLLTLGSGLFGTLLALNLVLRGVSPGWAGAVLAAYFVGFVVATVTAHFVITEVGHTRAFALFAAVAAVTALLHPIVDALAFWALLRLIAGYCLAGLFMITESWLSARARDDERGQILSMYVIAYYATLGCGQFLVGLGEPDIRLFSLTSILFSLSLVPVVMARAQAPVLEPPDRQHLARMMELSPLSLTAATGAGVANGAFLALGPFFAAGLGMQPLAVGLFMGTALLAGLGMQWPIGWLSDRIDRRLVMAGICLAAAAAAAALFVAGTAAMTFLPLMGVLYGGFAFPLYAQAVAHANDYAEPGEFPSISAGLLLANGVGAALAPLVAGIVMANFGLPSLFVVSGGVMISLGAFAIYRRQLRASLPTEQQTPFAFVPATTPVSTKLDTRGADEA
jgi:MFS family permease